MLNQCWNYLRPEEDKRRWWKAVQKELAVLIALSPILQSDALATFSSTVTCSDASESGGGFATSTGLTTEGLDMGSRLRDVSTSPAPIPVLVVSLFNGIGGAFRGYDLSGLTPEALIAVECDSSARRVVRRVGHMR